MGTDTSMLCLRNVAPRGSRLRKFILVPVWATDLDVDNPQAWTSLHRSLPGLPAFADLHGEGLKSIITTEYTRGGCAGRYSGGRDVYRGHLRSGGAGPQQPIKGR